MIKLNRIYQYQSLHKTIALHSNEPQLMTFLIQNNETIYDMLMRIISDYIDQYDAKYIVFQSTISQVKPDMVKSRVTFYLNIRSHDFQIQLEKLIKSKQDLDDLEVVKKLELEVLAEKIIHFFKIHPHQTSHAFDQIYYQALSNNSCTKSETTQRLKYDQYNDDGLKQTLQHVLDYYLFESGDFFLVIKFHDQELLINKNHLENPKLSNIFRNKQCYYEYQYKIFQTFLESNVFKYFDIPGTFNHIKSDRTSRKVFSPEQLKNSISIFYK